MSHEQANPAVIRLGRRAALRVAAGGGLAMALAQAGARPASAQAVKYRWDIVSVQVRDGAINLLDGGEASARSINGLRIAVKGSGTFVTGAPRDVTGGGTFRVATAAGATIFEGSYQVTELLSWQQEEGASPPAVDRIGSGEDARAGLAILRIAYPGAAQGLLFVSCQLVGTNPAVFEGIIATHSTVSFFNSEPPQDEPFVDANRTVFHIVR